MHQTTGAQLCHDQNQMAKHSWRATPMQVLFLSEFLYSVACQSSRKISRKSDVPSSANHCILGNVYLTSNLSRKSQMYREAEVTVCIAQKKEHPRGSSSSKTAPTPEPQRASKMSQRIRATELTLTKFPGGSTMLCTSYIAGHSTSHSMSA